MAQTGRPLKLTQTITLRDDKGAEVRKTVHQAIVDEVRATGHLPVDCATQVLGTPWAAKEWLTEARKLVEKPLTYPTHHQQVVVEFLRATQQAHAEWVAERQRLVSQLARGGLVTSRVTEKVHPTEKEPDGRPKVLEQTVVREIAGPNLAALTLELKYLARGADGRRIFVDRVEVTGADGGPIPLEDATEARARALLSEVDAYEAGKKDADAAAVEAELNGSQPSRGG